MFQRTKNKRIIIASLILFLAAGIFLFYNYSNQIRNDVSAAGEGWLTGWSRRKSITIDNVGISGTINGNTTLGSTGKFGTAFGFDGTGDYLSFADSDDWAFGSGDFTIDFWLNPTDVTTLQEFFGQRYGGSSISIQGEVYNGYISLIAYSGGTYYGSFRTATITANTWTHIALVRNGTSIVMYKNGVAQAAGEAIGGTTISSSSIINDVAAPWLIGVDGYWNPNYGYIGKIDEVRISKGIARWTSNFTPSTSAYTPDSYDKLLLHLNETSGTAVYSSTGSALTNYQTKITIPYDSDMQNDFDDLRFTSSDGSTLLDYWIESKTDSSTATVWVEVPSLAAGDNTIYMYYGKSDATSVSSGANTFIIFNDGTSLNGTTQVTMTGYSSMTWSLDSGTGELKATGAGGNSAGFLYFNQTTGTSNYAIDASVRSSVTGNYYPQYGFRFDISQSNAIRGIAQYAEDDNYNKFRIINSLADSAWSATQTRDSTVKTSWTFAKSGNSRQLFENSTLMASDSEAFDAQTVGLYFYDGSSQMTSAWFDNIRVRNFTAVTPAVTIGEESVEGCGTGGEVTIVNGYCIHQFKTIGTTSWTVPIGVTSIEYLVVAGGGGGGELDAGGGGGGGYIVGTTAVSGSYTITVGAGGSGAVASGGLAGTSGGNSSISEIATAAGGGGGATAANTAGSGGSGGGGSYHSTGITGGAASPSGQGNIGGNGAYSGGQGFGAGGGGGSTQGGNAVGGSSAGSGGNGYTSSISGTSVVYAGGGGGGGESNSYIGSGGSGGGGAGGGSTTAATSGTNGLGGGGGGGGYPLRGGGAGGSGIVIIKYALNVAPILTQVTAVSTPTSDTTPNYTFSSDKAGTITYGGDCSSSTTSAVSGNNTITFNTLATGTHSNCTIRVTDAFANQSNLLTVNSFTINSFPVYTSTNLTCSLISGSACAGTTILNLSASTGEHAELPTQSNYAYKVCCTGTNISNSCSGSYDTILKLSSATNAHAEKKTQSNYSGNDVCLSSSSTSVSCDYATSCSLLGSDYVCIASISGDTNAHIGECSAYSTKACCRVGVPVDTCTAKAVSDKSFSLKDTNIQLCSGADTSNPSDPCYSVCWKGTGTPVVTSSNWKCGVCHDSNNNPVSCSTASGTTFTWVMPTGYVSPTDYALISGTLTSANPIIKFTSADSNRQLTLNITSMGTSCSNQSSKSTPIWREVSPLK